MEQSTEQVNEKPVQFMLPSVVNLPILHPNKFAELIGLSIGVVGGWIDSGYLPTVKVGKYRMVNITQLTENVKQGW